MSRVVLSRVTLGTWDEHTVLEQSLLEQGAQMSRLCTVQGEQTVHEQTPIFVPCRRLNNHSHDLASKWL